MDRYAVQEAKEKVLGYYLPTPQDNTPEKREQAFLKAKHEAIKNYEIELENLKKLEADMFFGKCV